MTNQNSESKSTKRAHKATYARDKRKGGYLIRVIGPHAAEFVGREVPVTKKDDMEEAREKLTGLVWTGIDTGTEEIKGTGLPVALYTFAPHSREEVSIDF